MTLRQLTLWVLAAAIGLVPLVPPQHVHQGEGHGHTVVHRHAALHVTDHEAGHHDAVFDDADHEGSVLTLSGVFRLPANPQLPAPAVAAAPALVWPPTAEPMRPAPGDVERLIHGPPRTSASPRAPPLSVRL